VLLRALTVLSLIVLPTLAQAAAQAQSGLPLPRFVTIKGKESNVRVGPGYQYDVSWTYQVAGTPVEIIQEFDVWRKIRDVDGSVGWVHQNMLSGTRAGYVNQNAGDKLGMHASASDTSGIVAWVGPGFPVKIQSCDGDWCAVVATDHPASGTPSTYSGYLPENDLWGVFQGESFD
jgi:SH3-like domain-containing protein